MTDNRTRKRAELMKMRRELRFGTGGVNNKLTYPQVDGFMRRIVNIVGDRIPRLQRLGWKIVDDPEIQIGDASVTEVNTEVQGAVFTVDQTTGMKACLMEIPQEIWDADQAIKEETIALSEAEMKSSVPSGADYRRSDNKIE